MKKLIFIFLLNSFLSNCQDKIDNYYFDMYEKKTINFHKDKDFITTHIFSNTTNPEFLLILNYSKFENIASLSDNKLKIIKYFKLDFEYKNLNDISNLEFIRNETINCFGKDDYYLNDPNPLVSSEKIDENTLKIVFKTFEKPKKQKNLKEKFIFIYKLNSNIINTDNFIKKALVEKFKINIPKDFVLHEIIKSNKFNLIFTQKIIEAKNINLKVN